MSFVAVAGIVVGVGTAVYSADQARKNLHSQQDAQRAAQDADARNTAEAEASAAVAANATLADSKRRRRASSLLASGDPGNATSIDAAPTLLSQGSTAPRVSTMGGAGTALGAGAPATIVSSKRATAL